MSQVVSRSEAARGQLLALYGPVQEELCQVEELLRGELGSEHPFVNELVKHAFRIRGKRLRPALVLLAGKAIGNLKQEHLVLAAVIEMVHTASLIHDDVLDEAAVRRHLDTVNARWNNESSVLLGDYLFTHAFYLASTHLNPYACSTIGRATNRVCEGELRQVYNSGNLALAEEPYLEIIDGKTAGLIACACRLGAHFAGADKDVEERMSEFGRHLGIAFQIADDLLDVIGDEAKAGKSLGTDLEKRKATLPLIRVLQLANDEERAEVIAALEDPASDGLAALRPWLDRFEAIDYARTKARWYAEQALEQIAGLPDNPAVDVLRRVTGFVVARET